MTTAALPAIDFTPPLAGVSSPYGLDAATTWTEAASPEALRWLPAGVQFRLRAHRDPGTAGVWGAPWCVSPDDLDPDDDLKTGPPPEDNDPEPFEAQTIFAFDRLYACGNLSAYDRAEVRERAENTFAAREPIQVETAFATRALADAGTPTTVDDLLGAVSHLEETFAATGTVGLIHARVGLLSIAENQRLIVRDPALPGVLWTPNGQRWAFGGGYATPLGDTLIGTTSTFGWRDQVQFREAIKYQQDQYIVIAERSVIVGYEALIGAVEITP